MHANPHIGEDENPWLGLGTYKEGFRLYGRDVEVKTLTDVICNNIATVVFGKSGVGKSSLLHAGIFPEIRKNEMMPIYVRFEHNGEISYVEQIENAVSQYLDKEDLLGDDYPPMGLWNFFHRHVFYDKSRNIRIPVVVIDQFEEIYTLADEDHRYLAQELFEEFADLLNNIKPDRIVTHENNAVMFSESKIEMDTNEVLTFRVHSNKRANYVEDNNYHIVICRKHPIKYTTKISKAAIPIVGYAAFVI